MKHLSILVEIIPEQEQALRAILEEINHDLSGNPYVRFQDSPNTHFARFVIITDPENGPRLLFTSDFDGEFDDYLDDLARISPGADALWGTCRGYSGKANLPNFLREHSQKNRGVYVAFQDECRFR